MTTLLPVYICEDNAQIRAELESYLKNQILIENYDMRLTLSTRHPEDIIAAIRKTPGRGIYFLDVELNGESMDGFALGQEIRKHDTRGFIIYVTAYKELAFETFRYHLEALDYITKENPEKMYAGMSRCLHIITDRMCEDRSKHRPYFTVKIMDVVKHIPIDEILFFETSGRSHRIVLHADRDRIDFIGSMQELEKTLGERFIRVHRAYLINTTRISELDLKHREIIMDNDARCLFSRNMKERVMKYIS